ncbi:phosphatase [bacterium]|nr:phosphatase [bacterium]
MVEQEKEQGSFEIIDGDLIALAKEGRFDAISHGCNCFSTMGAGIALQMAKEFEADKMAVESNKLTAPILKLGNIDAKQVGIMGVKFLLINSYTQYELGPNLDYSALTLCMMKINKLMGGKHIGLPRIGCGIGGGDWVLVSTILKRELKDMKVTIVNYNYEVKRKLINSSEDG